MKQCYLWLIPLLLLQLLMDVGCGKDEINFSLIPKISFTGINPTYVQEYTEVVTITIAYEDGNGDIGQPDPDVPVVFVKDSRLQEPDGYHVPPVAPVGAQVIVNGQITIPLKNLFVLGNTTEEQLHFEVYLTDRAGNKSNILETPAVTVHK